MIASDIGDMSNFRKEEGMVVSMMIRDDGSEWWGMWLWA
jgi:hypothetical protein